MLENGFCEIGQKIRGRAEFHGAAQSSARLRVFLSILDNVKYIVLISQTNLVLVHVKFKI